MFSIGGNNSSDPSGALGEISRALEGVRQGLTRNQYDRTSDAQRGVQSSQQMTGDAMRTNQADAQRQQQMAQQMGQFTRGLQRDASEQQLYGDLAKGAQQIKAQEAANALNSYTQARANTQNFLASIMGTKF